jgi:hypothetical protein
VALLWCCVATRTPVVEAPGPQTVEHEWPLRHQPCDMPGNPREPAFVSLEAMLSSSAQALLFGASAEPRSCAFMRDESERERSPAEAKRFCMSVSKKDSRSVQNDCRALCVAQVDWGVFSEQHRSMVESLRALGASEQCRSATDPWVCIKGPRLSPGFAFRVSDAGFPLVEGQFVDGGATWNLTLVRTGACQREFWEVRQTSPPVVCQWTNVQTCRATAL